MQRIVQLNFGNNELTFYNYISLVCRITSKSQIVEENIGRQQHDIFNDRGNLGI